MFSFSSRFIKFIFLIAFTVLTSVKVIAQDRLAVLRDPTQPIGYRQTINREKPLVLQAIFFGDGKKKAIINGSAVKEGGSVNGKLIVNIKPTQVTYKSNSGLHVLKLRQSIFNK